MNKICEYCGNEFKPRSNGHRFCSDKCARAYRYKIKKENNLK